MIDALQFLPAPPDENLLYIGSYDPAWVIISVLLAILASYAALNASARIERLHDNLSKLTWTLISAFTLGIGVWAMHFIGMLALSLPCGIRYDPVTTLISMIPGILAAGIALGVAWNHGTKHLSPLPGSILLGAGIGTMHYTGMAAMRLEGFVRYDPSLFALSIIVAVALSYLALRVKSGLACLNKRCNVTVAVILGGAVSGMHYTAMSAAYFVRGDAAVLPPSLFTTNALAVIIAITTVFLALAALALATISHNREVTGKLAESEERWKFALEGSGDGVWDWNPQTDVALFSRRWKEMAGYAEHEFPDTGAAWKEHLHPDDKDRVLSVLQEYLTGKRPRHIVEFRMRCKDGSWKWILAKGKLISRDADGNPLRMIGTHTDISDRKQADDNQRIAATA
ncbi:MAG: MHYT domain-containing protein, partial [Sideroxyarcus sp.]|nr:MHYT domain-containing protein [Sideroxyarcus sp.]